MGSSVGRLRGGPPNNAASSRLSSHSAPSGHLILLAFGPLQVLMCGAEANRATAGDLPQPEAHFKFQSKNFFDLLTGKLILPFEGRRLRLCCPAPPCACGNHSGEAEHLSGVSLKLFAFIAESCSRSTRNTVLHHPGIAFTL
jgi:hypothetical protein